MNLEVQLSSYAARISKQGGTSKQTVRIESPLVVIYGNIAVVSFIRLVNTLHSIALLDLDHQLGLDGFSERIK